MDASKSEGRAQHLSLGGRGRRILGHGGHRGDLGVLQFGALLALELGAAAGEGRGLVGLLLVELALGVGEGQRAAVLDQLQEARGLVLGDDAGGAATERCQLPGLARLDGGAFGAGEAHSGEVWKRKSVISILDQNQNQILSQSL